MSRKLIGIVDYAVGNHSSVQRAFQSLNYRCKLIQDKDSLACCDLLVLPGVGSYPAAMAALNADGKTEFLRTQASKGQPIIGICLGMQLLADESTEFGVTSGLGLIPGKVTPLEAGAKHIGWNSIQSLKNFAPFQASDGKDFYFNHSYIFHTSVEYQVCVTSFKTQFATGVRRDNIVGLQFHPEKSQEAGRIILADLIRCLTSG